MGRNYLSIECYFKIRALHKNFTLKSENYIRSGAKIGLALANKMYLIQCIEYVRLSRVQMHWICPLYKLSPCRGVVERRVQMTSTMTRHVEHSEDFTKAHVESWLRI